MVNLSEEEIIKILNKYISFARKEENFSSTMEFNWHFDLSQDINILLDLYNKEKAKNKKYQGIENGTTIIYKSKAKYVREDRIEKYYIDKNKIREKIKELEEFQEQHKIGNWADIPIEDYDLDQINLLKELLGE